MQRGVETMAKAAADDAALQAQLAKTRNARATANTIRLPQGAAYGMTEDGRPVRSDPSKTNIVIPGTKADPTNSAASIAKYGPKPQDFQGMGFRDVANTIDAIPAQSKVADQEYLAAQRDAAHARAGTLPEFLPADAVLSESDNWPGSGDRRLQFPNAQPGSPVPGSPAHPVERMFGYLDDTVAQGGYPALMQAHPDMPFGAIAHQLEARRMREMGAWDPSFVSGGNY